MSTALMRTVPAEWYGEDYFTGKTSNYRGGYTWEQYQGTFEALAQLLMQSFPTARRFLDFGCAKGFLVQALHDQGLDAWGIDHSAYAISQAREDVRALLVCASLDSCAFVAGADVTVATEVLEHLTHEQLQVYLRHLAQSTELALFATVPMPSMRHRGAWAEAQEEPSHVTLQDRAWWHGLLRETGWRVGPMECLAERYFMNHPLVRTTGWNPLLASAPHG